MLVIAGYSKIMNQIFFTIIRQFKVLAGFGQCCGEIEYEILKHIIIRHSGTNPLLQVIGHMLLAQLFINNARM